MCPSVIAAAATMNPTLDTSPPQLPPLETHNLDFSEVFESPAQTSSLLPSDSPNSPDASPDDDTEAVLHVAEKAIAAVARFVITVGLGL